MDERHRRVVRHRGVVRRVPGARARVERVQLVGVRRDDLLEPDPRHPLGRGLVRPEHRVHPAAPQVQHGHAVDGRRLGGQVLDHEELPVVGRERLGLEVPSQVVGPGLGARSGRPRRSASSNAGAATSGSHPSGSGSISATAPPLSATTRTSRVPSSRTVGRGLGVRAVDGLEQRGAGRGRGREQPRAAEARHGPRAIEQHRPARDLDHERSGLGAQEQGLAGHRPARRVVRRALRARRDARGPPRTAPPSASSASATSRSAPVRASDVSLAPPSMTTTPRGAARFPGTRRATGGSARWRRPERGGVACADVDGSAPRCSSGRRSGGPRSAWADGGAYLDLDRTHYLPGQTARVEGYVSIPRAKQDLIERGPFYVFVVPPRTAVIEGRPIPAEAVRAGTVSIERDRGTTFELRGSFVVPELAGALVRARGLQRPLHDLGLPRTPDRDDLDRRHRARGRAAHRGQPPERTELEPAPAGPQGRARERGDPRAAHGSPRSRARQLASRVREFGVDRAAGHRHRRVRCCPPGRP